MELVVDVFVPIVLLSTTKAGNIDLVEVVVSLGGFLTGIIDATCVANLALVLLVFVPLGVAGDTGSVVVFPLGSIDVVVVTDDTAAVVSVFVSFSVSLFLFRFLFLCVVVVVFVVIVDVSVVITDDSGAFTVLAVFAVVVVVVFVVVVVVVFVEIVDVSVVITGDSETFAVFAVVVVDIGIVVVLLVGGGGDSSCGIRALGFFVVPQNFSQNGLGPACGLAVCGDAVRGVGQTEDTTWWCVVEGCTLENKAESSSTLLCSFRNFCTRRICSGVRLWKLTFRATRSSYVVAYLNLLESSRRPCKSTKSAFSMSISTSPSLRPNCFSSIHATDSRIARIPASLWPTTSTVVSKSFRRTGTDGNVGTACGVFACGRFGWRVG